MREHPMSWRKLNEVLHTLNEIEVLELLVEEQEVWQRKTVLQRLHERYCILRMKREREEIKNPGD